MGKLIEETKELFEKQKELIKYIYGLEKKMNKSQFTKNIKKKISDKNDELDKVKKRLKEIENIMINLSN